MAETPQHSWHPDPERDVMLDARLLRALAHPMRTKILGQLRMHGPATATTLAERLGVNSGATSYHLRQLADAGLVVEDDTRGNARDRWWKAKHRRTYFNEADLAEPEPELAQAYLYSIAQIYSESMVRAIDEMPSLPEEWRNVGTLSDFAFDLTPDQLKQLLDELLVVLDRYRTDEPRQAGAEPAEGRRRVSIQLQAFPRSITPPLPEPEPDQ
jgi:DNA-binding transcriptional ArsR family regulator